MAPAVVDLCQFDARAFAPILELESQLWSESLHWDFAASARMISACLDEKRLSGYALVVDGRVTGYCFFFHDGWKALIGNLFTGLDSKGLEAAWLLGRVVESLVNLPGVRRVETQLPAFSFEQLDPFFRAQGFRGYRRRFMLAPLANRASSGRAFEAHQGNVPGVGEVALGDFLIQPWEARHNREAAQLIYEAYHGHVDALINDQYAYPAGALKLVENIMQHSGCGEFLHEASRVAIYRPTSKLAAVLALTAVRAHTAHIPQVAVAREFQRLGLGSALMEASFAGLAERGFQEVSLTVTDINVGAVRLYERLGFRTLREFGAFAWSSP